MKGRTKPKKTARTKPKKMAGAKPRIEPSIESCKLYRDIGNLLGMSNQTEGLEPKDADQPPELTELSFNQMAEKLDIPPSTLTATIGALEKSLFGESRSTGKGRDANPDGEEGLFKVIKRDARKTLTETGIKYYWKAVELLKAFENFEKTAERRRDRVSIGSFDALLSSYIPEALEPFLRTKEVLDRPVFRLQVLDTPEIYEAVSSGRVDFAIGTLPTERDKALANALVKVKTLDLEIERGLLCHRDHSLANKEAVEATDLAREIVLRFPARATSPGLEPWLTPDFERGGDILEVRTFGVMIQFVKRNLGVAIVANLPGEIADAIATDEKLCFKPLPEVERATIAAYLPGGGYAALSGGARKVYRGVEAFFRGLAAQQTNRGQKKP
jgi:DNA-binding transcriptional LysR family regulator